MEQLAQVCYQRRPSTSTSPPRHAVPEVSTSTAPATSTHAHTHTSLTAPFNHFPTYSLSPYSSTNPSGTVFDGHPLASPHPTYGSNRQPLPTHPPPPQQQHLLPSLMTVIRPFPSSTAAAASTSPQALNEMFSLCLPASISASPPSVSSITFAARTRRRSRGTGVEQEATAANKKTELPAFIAEGFIDDIGSITYQTRLQSRGETVPFLFSDNTAPFVGQHVFIEVRFREAMTETDSSSLVKTVVSRLEGEICKAAPQVVARVRVVEKLVKELAGEWEVTLLQDLSLTKHKWRVSAMRPAPPSETTTVASSPSPSQSSSESSSSSTTSSPSPKQAPSAPHRSNLTTTSNSRPTSAEPAHTPATSESSSGPSKKKRKNGSHAVMLSEEVLEKLREFKARNFYDSAVANWDLSQYSTVLLSSRESPSPQVQR